MKSLIASLWGYIATGGAFLLTIFAYKYQKNRADRAELDRDTANANVDLLVKDKEVITDLDILREEDDKKSEGMLKKQRKQLENLKDDEINDRITTDKLMQLLGKTNDKD